MRGFLVSCVSLLATHSIKFVVGAGVPNFPESLLADPIVLQHPSVNAAFEEIGRHLSVLYDNTIRNGLSFAVVHASMPSSVYTFNNGTLKMNETELCDGSENMVDSDSIFRVMSVSKNVAMTSALVVSNHPNQPQYPGLSLDTPVRLLLQDFTLPKQDWNDGGSEITLGMLASHTAGIPRESYSTGFNMVLNSGKADAVTIGAAWASATAEDVIEAIATEKLMFAPGQRAAYSNAGISILGSAVAAYYNNVTALDLSWSQLATQELLNPLNMTHSFFGTVPQDLECYVGVPGGENWADLLIASSESPGTEEVGTHGSTSSQTWDTDGIVVLAQQSGIEGYESIAPTAIRDVVHEILAPAIAEALGARTVERFAGTYTAGRDSGVLTDVVNTNATNTATYARVEVGDQILYLRELVVNGSSALEAVDRLSWVSNTGPRYFSTEQGVVLEPAEGAAENAEFGQGVQAWRLIFPGLETCDWFDFDGYKDTGGWPVGRLVLVEKDNGVDLRYPPFDVVVTRT